MKNSRPFLYAASLFIVSAVLLTVIQPPVGWSGLAWVALIPFALACSPHVKTRGLTVAAFLAGFAYWLGNLYWVRPITTIGWLGMGLYLSLFWLLPALAIRFVRTKGFPLFVALPVLVVGFERLQGFPMGGFYWRFLGHSQYEHLALIQVADVAGAAGVSFVVAMVNGLITDLLLFVGGFRRVGLAPPQAAGENESVGQAPPYASGSRAPSAGIVAVGWAATLTVVAATLLYGQWRLRQTPEYVTEGPIVGSLQSNVPQSVKGSHTQSKVLFDDLMTSSRAAVAAGAELVVWPETMVQGILEPALWPQLVGDFEEDRAFHEGLCGHARDTAWVLVGAHGAEIEWDDPAGPYVVTYNSAYFYRPDGTRDPGRYDKIHLVLFGEYIPFKKWFPWLFERFMPEGYRPSLTLEKGSHYTVFEMARPGPDPNSTAGATLDKPRSPWRFGVIICYEDTIPYVGRGFTLDRQGRKRIDWLANISNDGWFVEFPEDENRVIPSTELPQHAAICAFRAVENRVPIIRSVNTGISCLVESTGRIRNGYLAASDGFPQEAMNRTAMAGWFTDRLPIDRRVTFYSRHGEWFADGCALVFIGVLLWSFATGWWRRRRSRQTAPQARKPNAGIRNKHE